MTKNYVELKIKANPYEMISEAVTCGLEWGIDRHFKHRPYPYQDEELDRFLQLLKAISETQHEIIMGKISDLFHYEEEEEC